MSVLEVTQLSIGYQGKGAVHRTLVQSLDLGLKKGQLLALIGANGAGKSTLLRVLSGLQKPLAGHITVQGRPLPQIPMEERPRQLAALFRNYARPDGLTARELVALGRQPHTGFWGRLDSRDHSAIDEALHTVGISHLGQNQINNLSDGEFQKAMVAKMLAQDAPIMLLDEPTTHLDLPSAIDLLKLLRKLATVHGKTILFSTHHLDLAFKMVPNILLIAGDGPWALGSPQVLSQHHLMCGFLRTRHIRLVDGNLSFELEEHED